MDALSNIGNFFSEGAGKGILDIAKLGTAGSGLIGNILNERARSGELSRISNAEKTLADPTALAKQVAAATQPLDSGLVQGVENTVDASLAEKGLAQAPGIARAQTEQALAPFQQANQNMALQLVLTRLGLPLEYAKTFLSNLPPNVNLAPLLALIGKGGDTGTLDPEILKLFTYMASPGFQEQTPSTYDPGNVLIPPDTSAGDIGDFGVPSDVFA